MAEQPNDIAIPGAALLWQQNKTIKALLKMLNSLIKKTDPVYLLFVKSSI